MRMAVDEARKDDLALGIDPGDVALVLRYRRHLGGRSDPFDDAVADTKRTVWQERTFARRCDADQLGCVMEDGEHGFGFRFSVFGLFPKTENRKLKTDYAFWVAAVATT